MMKRFTSNAALTVGIIGLGIAGLALLVWLSPQQASIPPAVAPAQHDPSGAAVGAAPAPASSAADPFRSQLVNPKASGTVPLAAGDAPVTVAPGIDPFKEKLSQQTRQATASPFSPSPAKP